MDMSRPPAAPASRSRRPLAVLVTVLAVVALAAAGGLAWLFGGGAPAAPTIDTAAETATPAAAVTAGPTATGPASSVLPSASATADAGSGTAAIDGTWTLDPTVGSFADFSGSWAGYRVKEELANIGATEAVGRTQAVTATLVVRDGTLVSGTVSVDLTTLVSDRPMRDGRVQDALGTVDHPTAELAIGGPVELPAGIGSGEAVSFELPATLTLHGVEASFRVPVSARVVDGVAQIVGTLPVTLTGFGIEPPSSFMVLSVGDDAAIEFQLFLRRG